MHPRSPKLTSTLLSSSRSTQVLQKQSRHNLGSSSPATTHRSSTSNWNKWRSQAFLSQESHSPVTGPSHHGHSSRPALDLYGLALAWFLLGHPKTRFNRYHVQHKEVIRAGHLSCGKHPFPVPALRPPPLSNVSPILASSSAENCLRSQCQQ